MRRRTFFRSRSGSFSSTESLFEFEESSNEADLELAGGRARDGFLLVDVSKDLVDSLFEEIEFVGDQTSTHRYLHLIASFYEDSRIMRHEDFFTTLEGDFGDADTEDADPVDMPGLEAERAAFAFGDDLNSAPFPEYSRW